MTFPNELVVRRHVAASPTVVFDAWTDADQLRVWWGPAGIECTHAEVDLRVGGEFRLANRGPDGNLVWIAGIYEVVERPHLLRHTWYIESAELPAPERVTVEFIAKSSGTDIVVTHTGIDTEPAWTGHQQGWFGCLDGLVELLG